jgi:hypothetical protein
MRWFSCFGLYGFRVWVNGCLGTTIVACTCFGSLCKSVSEIFWGLPLKLVLVRVQVC